MCLNIAGDVFLIGCTNVGKSSLFNDLLHSDYCKVQAVDLVQRATISPWPGTTLNLLKFPILNPSKWRLYWRTLRLKSEKENERAQQYIQNYEFMLSRNIKHATLQGTLWMFYVVHLEFSKFSFFFFLYLALHY